MSIYEQERRRQIESEIRWLKIKLKTVTKAKYRDTLIRQLKESEYNLAIGIFDSKHKK